METKKATIMKFEDRTFSEKLGRGPIKCATFVVHVKNGKNKPIGTAAAFVLPNGEYWMGIALLNPLDQFVKKVGRAKAIGRAYALFLSTVESDGKIWFDKEGWSKSLVECLKFEVKKQSAFANLRRDGIASL